jgi:hypothetical protein
VVSRARFELPTCGLGNGEGARKPVSCADYNVTSGISDRIQQSRGQVGDRSLLTPH